MRKRWAVTVCFVLMAAGGEASGQTLTIEALDPVVSRGTAGTQQRVRILRSGDTSEATTVTFQAEGSGSNPATASDFLGGLPIGSVTFAGDNLPSDGLIARPTLTNPVTYTNLCPEDPGGPKRVAPGKDRDVLITFPTDRDCKGSFALPAVNDVIILGGKLVCDGGTHCPQGGGGGGAGFININGVTGTVHIEGVHFDANDKMIDVIRSNNSPGARVVVQNTRVEAWKGEGTTDKFHGDCVHSQGGGIMASQSYQNMTCDANVSSPGGRNAFQIPMRTGSGTGAHVTLFDGVNVRWSQPTMGNAYNLGGGSQYGDLVSDQGTTLKRTYAQSLNVLPPKTTKTDGGGDCKTYATFPKYATGNNKITGVVCEGHPAGGDFAPADKVGRNYNRSKFE